MPLFGANFDEYSVPARVGRVADVIKCEFHTDQSVMDNNATGLMQPRSAVRARRRRKR
jgi:hypothetical protein